MANQISVNTGSGAGAQQVIVDSNGNITVTVSRSVIGTVANVASANYANFAGTVLTNAQPNITSVGTLSNLTVSNTITTNNLVVTGNFSVGNLVANNANYANFAGNAFAVAGANVSGTVANATFAANAGFATTAGSANTANSAIVANSANSVAGANVSGTVANATYALDAGNANFANSATVASSANSVTLANVSGAGNIASINLDGSSSNVLRGDGTFAPEGSSGNANYANFAGNAFSVDGSNVVGTVANATFALDAGNANIANIAYSVAAANVSGLGNIATINLDGNASNVLFGNGSFGPEGSTGNANYANFAGNAFSVDGSNVVGAVANATFALDAGNANIANIAYSVDGANVSGAVANATFALDAGNANIANIAYSVDAANVSGLGNIATINLDGNVSNLLTGNGTFVAIPTTTANANYANFAGTVLTNAQPNITSVGTLTALTANTTTPITVSATNGNVAFFANNNSNISGTRLSFVYNNPVSNTNNIFGAQESGFDLYQANTAPGNVGTGNIRSYWQFLTDGTFRHTVGGTGNIIAKNLLLGNVFTGQFNGNIIAGNGNLGVGNITLNAAGKYTGNAAGLTNIPGANITGFVPNANVANTAYSVAAANVSGLGNIAVINLDGNASNLLDGTGNFVAIPGGGSVAGSNTQIQFNSNGAFGASSALTFDGANLQVTGNISVNANTSNQPITVNNEGNGGISSYNMYNDTSVFAVQNFYRTRGNISAPTAVGTNDTVFTQNYGAYGDSGNTFVSLGYQENKVGTNSGNAISLVTNFNAQHPGSSFTVSGYDSVTLNNQVNTGNLNINSGNVQVNGRQLQLTGQNTGAGNISSINLINGALNWTLDDTQFGGGTPFGMNRYITGFMDPMNYFTARGNPSSPADVQLNDIAFNERVQVRYDANTHGIFNSDVNVRSFSPSNAVAATYSIGSYDDQANSVFQVNFGAANIAGDINATGNISLTTGTINYLRTYGQWQNLNTITPAANNTAAAFALPTIDFASVASVGSTSRIIPGAAGMYKLQFSVQIRNDDAASEHIAYFWWRKNGVDVPNSMGRVGVPKAVGPLDALEIAGWDNMISSANSTDYWELMYAVDNITHVDFPTFGVTAFGPETAALFVTLVPVGA